MRFRNNQKIIAIYLVSMENRMIVASEFIFDRKFSTSFSTCAMQPNKKESSDQTGVNSCGKG